MLLAQDLTVVEEVVHQEVVVMEEAEEEEQMVRTEAEEVVIFEVTTEVVTKAKAEMESKVKGESPAPNVSSVMEIMPPLNVAT